MEANDFIAKLKANGTSSDISDLNHVFREYKVILGNLPNKDRGCFSLNLLCILCRNLDKVPSWCKSIDCKALLTLSIECIRETRTLDQMDRVKSLACVYHLHKYIVRQNAALPPELVLKISYMLFECPQEKLLKEYSKTYWNILADRLTYLEKLKSSNMAIIKLLPKLSDDIVKVISIYDSVQFTSNILNFLIKKLYFLYSDRYNKELNETFGKIFESLSKRYDLSNFKKLQDKDIVILYGKFNDLFYVIAENASKIDFKESVLNIAVRSCVSMFGHSPEIFHCLQTFYLNSFCCILTEHLNVSYVESVLNSLPMSCETTEKLGYIKSMRATYPYINKFLRLFIEYCTNSDKSMSKQLTTQLQENCIKSVLFLMDKMKNSDQLLKCDGCPIKSGLHDALCLSFLTRNFLTISMTNNQNLTKILPIYLTMLEKQYSILNDLKNIGCVNHEKCLRKLQTDVHNTAVMLNQSKQHSYSIKLFDIYIEEEFKSLKSDSDLKNISRAYYNKGICEVDFKRYEKVLSNAFLSLIFAQPDGLTSEKYMSLAMDAKAKSLKQHEEENDNQDNLQLVSVLEAAKLALNLNPLLKPFLSGLKFSTLLRHEFDMYVKLWPSVAPIAGVWRAFYELLQKKHSDWLRAEPDKDIRDTFYQIILETPGIVRTIHNEEFKEIICGLINLVRNPPTTFESKIVLASLLFLKAEFDLSEASEKYGWKVEPSQNLDPDQVSSSRTFSQEHGAMTSAVEAVNLLTELLADDNKDLSSTSILQLSLPIYEIFVQQFLYIYNLAYGLQLAHICCRLSEKIGDKEHYILSAGVILYYAYAKSDYTTDIMAKCTDFSTNMMNNETLETTLIFICNLSMHYSNCGSIAAAAHLLQVVQAKVCSAMEMYPDINLDLAIGHLLEGQRRICLASGPSALTAAIAVQRHYLSCTNSASRWTQRRLLALTLKCKLSQASSSAVRTCRAMLLWRRARAGSCAALSACAHGRAAMLADVTNAASAQDARVKIDNGLKNILGLEQTSDISLSPPIEENMKQEPFTPKQENLETMLDCQMFKKTQTSPSLPCITVPGYKNPDFYTHPIKCSCYLCQTPSCFVIACQTFGLDASTYFRAKEFAIAKNYFEGVIKSFALVENKLKWFFIELRENRFEKCIVDIAEKINFVDFKNVQIKILIENTFFELSQENYIRSDDLIVTIHEMMQDLKDIDPYLKNEVMNLMTTSAQLRKIVKPPEMFDIETEFASLKIISPVKIQFEEPKTPITKTSKPPKDSVKYKLKDEDLPKINRKISKLNLEDDDEIITNKSKPKIKKTDFKIPEPVTSRPVLENITPRPNRSKPSILITQPSEENKALNTPMCSKNDEFFTPIETPKEQFFTPMTSMKTYGNKKSLRQTIVKNLESEFSTPKSEIKTEKINKENTEKLGLPARRTRVKEDPKKVLKRATSPGKLSAQTKSAQLAKNAQVGKEVSNAKDVPKGARTRRLRQPVNFSLDKDDFNDKS